MRVNTCTMWGNLEALLCVGLILPLGKSFYKFSHSPSLPVSIAVVTFDENHPRYVTQLGEVEGYYKQSHNGRSYLAFEGIPYAKPPVGNLRFKVREETEEAV